MDKDDTHKRLIPGNIGKRKAQMESSLSLESLPLYPFVQGIIEGVRGPILIDLTELFQTEIDKISAVFIMYSTGSIVGCFFSKIEMRKTFFLNWAIRFSL